jgi:hypothetical protein
MQAKSNRRFVAASVFNRKNPLSHLYTCNRFGQLSIYSTDVSSLAVARSLENASLHRNLAFGNLCLGSLVLCHIDVDAG